MAAEESFPRGSFDVKSIGGSLIRPSAPKKASDDLFRVASTAPAASAARGKKRARGAAEAGHNKSKVGIETPYSGEASTVADVLTFKVRALVFDACICSNFRTHYFRRE